MRAAALLLAAAACAHHPRGPRVIAREPEVLVNEHLATAAHVGAIARDLDVSPRHLVVLADADRLYAVGWGGIAPIAIGGADSFAYTPDGALLLIIRGDQLHYLDAHGAVQQLFALPHAGMALATGAAGVVYLYDRSGDPPYGLYELLPGRRVAKLFDAPAPIDAVAQAGDRLLFASGGLAFDATPGHPMRVIARLDGTAITSVAGEGDRVYVSDGRAVYAIEPNGIVVVSSTLGGSLRVRDGALLVLDAARHLLVRLAPH